MMVIVIVLVINNTYSNMETTTATALATTAITTSELNTVAEDVQFEDINVTTAPSVNFLEANTSAISIEELTVNCVVPTWANQELTISHQDFINTVHDAACNVFSGELTRLLPPICPASVRTAEKHRHILQRISL